MNDPLEVRNEPGPVWRRHIYFSGGETRAIQCLESAGIGNAVSHGQLTRWMSYGRPAGEPWISNQQLRGTICKINRKLNGSPFQIKNKYGNGYSLEMRND